MDSLPIELIENILIYSTGSTFSRSARVATNWLKASENIERTSDWFWHKCCHLEIDSILLDDINPYNQPLGQLDELKCKQIYISWFRTQNVHKLSNNCIEYNESFGSNFNGYENISSIAVTGTLVVSGHSSGRVNLIDCYNDQKPMRIVQHIEPVIDVAVVNLFGDEKYELHKLGEPNGYPTRYPSFSNHHHIVSLGCSTIFITPITGFKVGKPFEICPLTPRHFLKLRVCGDLIAVSTKLFSDISLFRMVLPKSGALPIKESLKVEILATIPYLNIFHNSNLWLGLFSLGGRQLNTFCHESNQIACSDVRLNLLNMRINDNVNWMFSAVKQCVYEFGVNPNHAINDWQDLNIQIVNGFSFGNGIFFLITNHNQTVYTIDSQSFRVCPLEHFLKDYDKVTTITMFGAVLACGTEFGYVYVHHIPALKRLHFLTHYKPLFADKVCSDRVIRIAITDNGLAPVMAVADKHKLYVVNWNCERNQTPVKVPEVIQCD